MNFLVDAQLSLRMKVWLAAAGYDAVHTLDRLNGFAIVTKDEDYNNLSVVRGIPPPR